MLHPLIQLQAVACEMVPYWLQAENRNTVVDFDSPKRQPAHHLIGSFHPIGTNAAATASTPLSVASKLNCAAAFLVSCTSTRIPKELINLLVSGEMGIIRGPSPNISRSGFGHTTSNRPHAFCPTSHCPLLLTILFRPCVLSVASQGFQPNASPEIRRHPLPPPILMPLSRWKPWLRHASMEVVGAGVLPRTFITEKSVWVSSSETGPRLVVAGALDGGGWAYFVDVVRRRDEKGGVRGWSGGGEEPKKNWGDRGRDLRSMLIAGERIIVVKWLIFKERWFKDDVEEPPRLASNPYRPGDCVSQFARIVHVEHK